MKKIQATTVSVILALLAEVTLGGILRDPEEPSTGVLLSALCLQDGQLRKSCLENISTVSIQKFLDKLIDHVRDNDRYGTLLRDLDLSDKSDVLSSDDVITEKRGRPRQTSGFYSNW